MTQANNVAIESSQINSAGVLQPTGGGTGTASGVTDFKNRIINGAMVIDQRNSGASFTPTISAYTLDRWGAAVTQSSKYSVQQNAGSVTPPVGFSKYIGVTSLSSYSVGASDYFHLYQAIEGFNIADLGWGTANAKTITVSFQVYSSLTGTFGGSIFNGSANYSYPFTYSIPVANTWTSISITVAGPTSGSWTSDNSAGLYVNFGLGVGSTYSATAGSWQSGQYRSATGAVSVVGTNGATFYITGVQLEVGSSATGFGYRPYGTELALCQRYFYAQSSLQSGASSSYNAFGTFSWTGSTAGFGGVKFPVTMRIAPSVTSTAGTSFFVDPGVANFTTTTLDQISPNFGFIQLSGGSSSASAGFTGRFLQNNTTTAYLNWSAEL